MPFPRFSCALTLALAIAGCSDGVISSEHVPHDPDQSGQPTDPGGPRVLPEPADENTELSLGWLEAFIASGDVTSIPQFLAGLPESVGESFVLMERSRSRHFASLEFPRVIMYGTDARFIAAVGSHPDDPLREVAEVAVLDEATGHWAFRAIEFNETEATMTDDNSGCVGCHGDPARPIWGNYPDWTGAFGEIDEVLTLEQIQSALTLRENQADSDRFFTLGFPSEFNIADNGFLYLPSRRYGFANTSFNFELAVAVTDGLVTRMKAEPAWDDARFDVLTAHLCGGSVEERVAGYARVGIDGPNDFQLAHIIGEATQTGYETFGWNQGSTRLEDIVAFRILDEVVRTDPGIAAAVAPIEEMRARLVEYWFELRGEERRTWLRDDFTLDDYDMRPQELLPPVLDALCAELMQR